MSDLYPERYPDPYHPARSRYDDMPYRFCGRSGLRLPVVSLGMWWNFGDDNRGDVQRAIARRAFDRGVTHFDLANNYGPPYGQAEENLGRLLRQDFAAHRDELLISTKAGWDMWPGPYGQGGGSRKYVLASLDQSLRRLGLDYVDIFYSHRFDPDTPLEETMRALDHAVRSGKALYVGISSYSASATREAADIARALGTPLLIHQPSYSLVNRWIESPRGSTDEVGATATAGGGGLLDELERQGMGCISFGVFSQGLLSDRYLRGVPEGSRAARPDASIPAEHLAPEILERVRGLNEIARERGQTLAQMALAWVLRDPRMTSAVVGVSRVDQLDANLDAVAHLEFTDEELRRIDDYAVESGINLWADQTRDDR